MGMKGSKKKKSRQLDEDFVVSHPIPSHHIPSHRGKRIANKRSKPILRPIGAHEVQKVAAAIRQSMENKNMMSRLLQRIQVSLFSIIETITDLFTDDR